MVLLDARKNMLRRAAKELKSGMTVNLGIGLPTQLVDYMDSDVDVCMHSENGITGVGPIYPEGLENPNLIDAGGNYISTMQGAAFMDSAVSFALVRSGKLDLTVLGAFEISAQGDLANWVIPGKFTPGVGGGMELAQKANRVVILTEHQDKKGHSKIKTECTLPLTAAHCVNRIYTNMAVLDISPAGLILRELANGLSIADVVNATEADLIIPEETLPVF